MFLQTLHLGYYLTRLWMLRLWTSSRTV